MFEDDFAFEYDANLYAVADQAERDAVAEETALASHYADDAAKLIESSVSAHDTANASLGAMQRERALLAELRAARRAHAARLRARSKFFS